MTKMRTFEGGCHCRRVRFRVATDKTTVYACNCSICAMKGFVHLIVPPAQFELLSGEEDLSEYRFGTRTARHRFCRHCGVQSYYTPRSHPNDVSVNVRCLDTGQEDGFDVQPFDGANWEKNVAGIQ